MQAPDGTPLVRLDRALLFRFLVFLLPMFWPLLAFGQPSYITDSVGYWKGGQKIASTVMEKVLPAPDVPVSVVPGGVQRPAAARNPQDVIGVRSITYSAVTYLLQWPGHSMILLIVAQLGMCAFVSAVVTQALGVRSTSWTVGIALALACLTPVAIFASNAVPDILNGVVTGIYILMFVALDRLSLGTRALLALIGVFCITAHASTPPLILGLILLFGLVVLWRRRKGAAVPWPVLAWTIVPFLIAIGITSAGNRVAFGTSDVYGKRYPLALARSVADGPGRWYLQSHCRTERWAVCEVFGTTYPTTVSGFVFDDTGLAGRATGEQMDRIRAEEYELVRRAARAYPFFEASNFAKHVFLQLCRFGYRTSRFDMAVVTQPDGTIALAPNGRNFLPQLHWLNVAAIILVIACIAAAVLLFRRFDARQRFALWLFPPMMLGNAVIVVVFSGIVDRYQARMIWLLPLFVLSAVAVLAEDRNRVAVRVAKT